MNQMRAAANRMTPVSSLTRRDNGELATAFLRPPAPQGARAGGRPPACGRAAEVPGGPAPSAIPDPFAPRVEPLQSPGRAGRVLHGAWPRGADQSPDLA